MGIRESRWHDSIRRARATVAQVREQDRLHRAAQFAGSKLFVALREAFTAQEKANASFFDLDDHERWRKRCDRNPPRNDRPLVLPNLGN
jgi:hypothetical protein